MRSWVANIHGPSRTQWHAGEKREVSYLQLIEQRLVLVGTAIISCEDACSELWHHVELLKQRVHVACGALVLQADILFCYGECKPREIRSEDSNLKGWNTASLYAQE